MKYVGTIALWTGITSTALAAGATPKSITALEGTVKILAAAHPPAAPLGLFRAGQTLPLASPEPVGVAGCEGGWYAVKPRGFVCATKKTTFTVSHPRALAARAVLPDDAGYPFQYGTVSALTPRYLRFPSPRASDDPLLAHLGRAGGPQRHAQGAYPGMKIAWAREVDWEGERWVVTPELLLVQKKHVTRAASVLRRSAILDANAAFPFAVPLRDTPEIDEAGAELGSFGQTSLVPLAAGRHRGGIDLAWRHERRVARTRADTWIEKADVSVFASRTRPPGVDEDEKWIHVRVNEGSLVAYEGDRPVFAAVISPGMHGANPKGTYRTPTGRYRISSKHLTSDMGGRLGQGSWRTRSVPWVAYYDGSFALHGAWWHDGFGRPRSHGCINLTPGDARALFKWLDPQLPRGWYAVRARAEEPGTVVLITP